MSAAARAANPLLEDWGGSHALPPFERIAVEHFEPAFAVAMAEQVAEVAAIVATPGAADFANTVEALERSGRTLRRVSAVFYCLTGAHTNEALQAVERAMAPRLAAHRSCILMDEGLFARLQALSDAGLDAEQARVLELYRRAFVNAGAHLRGEQAERMRAIMQRLSEVGTAFAQNVLADERDWTLVLGPGDLDGLPGFLIDGAREAARERGLDGAHVITLARASVEPFLTFSTRRDLRERAWRAWTARGESSNWPLVDETVRLRAERARLLGFASFAALRLHDQMAKTPAQVRELLMAVWAPARVRAGEERAALAALALADGLNEPLEAWDWRFYAERERKRLHDLDESETKPYLQLERVIEAAFHVAGRLFGLRFEVLDGVTLQHPDARAWTVQRADGTHLGVFIGDYFARPSKRSGAWMSVLRGQQGLWAPQRPVVLNTLNLARGGPGEPTLLSFDDARTVFHEFGHALHGLMSEVRYPMVAGTAVARDFVELPSQLFEHWLQRPEVLSRFARHHQSDAPMPADLIDKLRAAATFNQGFATVEYSAAALVDLAMHEVHDTTGFEPRAFAAATLAALDVPAAMGMRHRTPHFLHVFAGEGYAAGYYSYLWSETMDADAFQAFEEAGDPFDADTAARLARTIYSAGGRQDPADAYRAFRGKLPGIEALLAGRGLA